MFNFDYITKEDIKQHNPKWPKLTDHPYRIINWWLWIWKSRCIT